MTQTGLKLNPIIAAPSQPARPEGVEPGPDVHSSTDAYAQRFARRTGRYFLATQLKGVMQLLADHPGASVLDVGGGHAQIAPAMVDAGYDVTVHGSADACRARPDRLIGADRYKFLKGDLLHLPADDQSYDVVVAIRMMAHVGDPVRFVGELCRVARKAVVIDFSAHDGLMRGASRATYGFKNWAEHNTTRKYNNYSRAEIHAMFEGFGLSPDRSIAQYLLPMVLHRQLRVPPISRGIEVLARVTGLTRRFGSPVLLRASR